MNNDICLDVLRLANACLASFFDHFSGTPACSVRNKKLKPFRS